MKKIITTLLIIACMSLTLASLQGCKTATGDKVAAATGIGDGKVSLAENLFIKVGVSKILSPKSAAVITGLHIISAGMLEKLGDDPTSLEALEEQLQEVIEENGITGEEILSAVDDLTADLKSGLSDQLGESDDSTYLVGLKAVLEEIYSQTGV
jgi:hypothetical protein